MGRVTNAILTDKAYNQSETPMLDLEYGGMFGWSPNLTEWVSNQAYINRDIICFVLEAPRFFQLMPNPDKWISSLKALMEVHTYTIEGLNMGLTVDTEEHPVGGAGEMMEEYTNVTRARSQVSTTVREKYGLPVSNFLYNWIVYGMMDPDTKYALSGTLPEAPEDALADWYTMTCLFTEPDPTHTRPLKSWIGAGMFPKNTGDIIGRKARTDGGSGIEINIEWTGIYQSGRGPNKLAQKLLDSINLIGANPYTKPAFVDDIHPDIKAAENGYVKSVEDSKD